jgi:hypothetical protein
MRIPRMPALVLAALAASACDNSTGPKPGDNTKSDVSLDFCAGSAPAWLAVQNEGENWTQVTGNSSGTFTFQGTSKLSIAFVTTHAGDHSTEILNVTRAELEGISGKACKEGSGTKSLTGTVAGLTGQQVVRISMVDAVAGASPGNPHYTLAAIPDGAHDLVVTRRATSSTQPPDRIIVRRGLNLQSGATIPALDFATTEALPLPTATATLANRGTDFVDLETDFLTSDGAEHQLMHFTSTNASAFTYVSVPVSMRGATDLHRITTFASSATGTREVSQFYREPSDRTLTFGPDLSNLTMSIASSTPYVRPRLSVPSQAEYPTAMEAFFGQLSGSTFRTVRIFTTAAFLGGRPATWTLDMPDLSAAGYQSTWAFPNTALINANARGFDGSVPIILGADPVDGQTIKSAIRATSTIVALDRSRVSSFQSRRVAP